MKLLLLASAFLGQAKDDLFDLKAILTPPLDARVLKSSEKDGTITEEVRFFSEKDGDKTVEIFAFFSYPKGAKNLPAFIWNQGGLAQATTHFTELGARRGYAVLCIDFPIAGYRSSGGYPINSGLELPDDPRKAPIHRGAVALLRAVSFLESRPEVDKDRIGMAGSSWGGFFTTLMGGVDPRLKAASSMFGAGNLHLGNNWWDGNGKDPKRDDAFRKRWQTSLDPAFRLPRSKTPIAWFTGTNDLFYWLPGVSKSYEMAAGPKHLAFLPNFDHSLTPELDEQVFTWLDIHLKGSPAFLKVSPLTRGKETPRELTWKFEGKRKIHRAELAVSFGPPGNWRGRYWMTVPAKIDGEVCRAVVPDAKQPALAFATVIDSDGFRSSTLPIALEGVARAAETPKYDGLSMWNPPHEKEKQQYRLLHGLPPFTLDSEGAIVLGAGKHSLGPVYFTADVRHRLQFEVRSAEPTKIEASLEGTFDGKKITSETISVATNNAWTASSLLFTPPACAAGSLRIQLVIPGKGASIRGLSFTPE